MHGASMNNYPAWREEISSGSVIGPNLFTCGLYFNRPIGDPIERIKSKTKNYDFIKVYDEVPRSDFEAIMNYAKKENIYTIGHIPEFEGAFDDVCRLGMNEIAHINEIPPCMIKSPKSVLGNIISPFKFWKNWMEDVYQYPDNTKYVQSKDTEMNEMVTKIKNAGISVHTTLALSKIFNQMYLDKESFLKRPELKYYGQAFENNYMNGSTNFQQLVNLLADKYKEITKEEGIGRFLEAKLDIEKQLLKKLNAEGVPLLLGTDCTAPDILLVPGFSIHDELEVIVESGFSPFEALKMGTANAGQAIKAMTGKNTIGTIEINKQADFILTNKNPLEDVKNTRDIFGIMLNGVWLSKENLDDLVLQKKSMGDLLSLTISKEGLNAAIAKYSEIKRDSANSYFANENQLNLLGYNLFNANKIDEALEIFKINVAEFPYSSNVYDSLGEVYVKKGMNAEAYQCYKKSVELNPNNINGKKMMKKLGE
jgi:tetratricopeptide (TPR) repeat protein